MNVVEFKQHRIGSDEPYAELFEERLSEADVKKVTNEANISFLFKVKIFPFRKLNETIVAPSVGTARFGGPHTGVADQAKDNGILGAGIDFGLPDGSGVGYGEEAPFKHSFSVTRLSYFFK